MTIPEVMKWWRIPLTFVAYPAINRLVPHIYLQEESTLLGSNGSHFL